MIVGVRFLDPMWLKYGLSADLHRTEEEAEAYRERLHQAWEAIEKEDDDE